jgi:nitroreductase
MPNPNTAALEFLLSRRSHPAKTLTAPAPEGAALEQLFTAALRVPDHGKLEPWRLIVLAPAALPRLAAQIAQIGAQRGVEPEKLAKTQDQFADAPLIVCVIESPKDSDKIPALEQTYSAGAACLSLVNAALAAGWGANWITGWAAFDPQVKAALAVAPHETIAGFIHIGTPSATPPERPRPDVAALTTWVTE